MDKVVQENRAEQNFNLPEIEFFLIVEQNGLDKPLTVISVLPRKSG
jgi:hypothetical protein